MKWHWFHQVILGVDQLLNAIIGGWADETISSRAWRLHQTRPRWAVARYLIDALFFMEPDHCQMAYLSERNRLQQPPELRSIQ